jgi:hypothetical protein
MAGAHATCLLLDRLRQSINTHINMYNVDVNSVSDSSLEKGKSKLSSSKTCVIASLRTQSLSHFTKGLFRCDIDLA